MSGQIDVTHLLRPAHRRPRLRLRQGHLGTPKRSFQDSWVRGRPRLRPRPEGAAPARRAGYSPAREPVPPAWPPDRPRVDSSPLRVTARRVLVRRPPDTRSPWVPQRVGSPPMSSDVRVHVRLGAVRVVYEGEQSFYEKHVESLVVAAAKRGIVAFRAHGEDAAEAAGRNGEVVDAAPEDDDAESSETEASESRAEAGAPPPAAVATGFVPASGEFGRYIRKLGPEAAEPD